jgi:hypothetical protein
MNEAAGFHFDALTLLGLASVAAMVVCYAFEERTPWAILGFALSCFLGATYAFFQGAWPFTLAEFAWGFVALARFRSARRRSSEKARPQGP